MRIGVVVGVGAAAALAAGGAAWLLGRRGDDAPRYQTAEVSRGSIREGVTATGTLAARVTVQVGSQVSGTISALAADFNDTVRRGQVIARLDPSLFQAEVAAAKAATLAAASEVDRLRAAIERARLDVRENQVLADRGYAPAGALERARVALRAAEAEVRAAEARVAEREATLDRARANLDHTVITAPIDGIVVDRGVELGQTVAASLQAPRLFTIAGDLRHMEVQIHVDEADVGKLREGLAGRFTVDAFPGREFSGTVRQIRNVATTVENVVTYVAVLDVENPDLRLRPGMTAQVTIETARRDDVVRVPNAALRFRPSDGGQPRARVRLAAGEGRIWRQAGGAIAPTTVKLGITDGELTEVLDGVLRAGEQVVTGQHGGPAAPGGHGGGPPRRMGRPF